MTEYDGTLHISTKHQALVVPFSDPVLHMFPEAQLFTFGSKKYHLVPHRPAESFILRSMGFTVPSPILTHYTWPGAFKPFAAQMQTSALLTMNARAYVLNSMGTGKTSSALWAWDYLYEHGIAKKLLVIAPLSTLKFTWLREVFTTLPHRRASIIHHYDRNRRVQFLNDESKDIYIINHDGAKLLNDDIDRLLKKGIIDTIVLDELAVYRNGKAQRTKLMMKLAERAKFAWGMSGSPMPRSVTDVWAQCRIITPHTVQKFYSHFRDMLQYKINEFKWVNKPGAVDTAYECMKPSVRFTLDDVTELPDVVHRTLDIPMGKVQSKVYKEMLATCRAIVGDKELSAANAGAMMMKLLQISTGWVYDRQRGIVPLDGDAKLDKLIETIDEAEKKVLVFVPFIHALDGISKRLTAEGIDHACVSGKTNITSRSKIFNIFQNTDNIRVLVAHPQCLAHGVTLTAASVIVWFAPVTSLEIYEQANARIRRVGQKSKQLVLHFQATSAERKIYKLLQDNQKVQEQFLDLFADETLDNPIT